MRARLLAWYGRHARALPWRAIRDPYAIWVSETMLQQTQVATTVPYYRRFLRQFPTIHRLAAAPPDEVLAAWAGLGYYRRARSLHAAAVQVVRDHRGKVPDDPAAFGSLPGVGRYTAGAVLSIAFDRPLPVLDGNVARVLSRRFGLEHSVRDPAGARVLWGMAEALVPMRDPGAWNQALMELGAIVCLPRAPRCGDCPIARGCVARREGRVEALPPAPPRRAPERVRRAIALLEWRGRWVVARRSGALLDRLWEPPGVELADGEDAGAGLRSRLLALGLRARVSDTGKRVRHTITHRRIEVQVWHGRLATSPPRRAGLKTVTASAAATHESGVALTALARQTLAAASERSGTGATSPARPTARGRRPATKIVREAYRRE